MTHVLTLQESLLIRQELLFRPSLITVFTISCWLEAALFIFRLSLLLLTLLLDLADTLMLPVCEALDVLQR